MRRDYAKRSCSIKSAVKLRRVPAGCWLVVIQRSILPGKGCGRLTSDSLKSTDSSCDLVMQMTWSGVIGDQQCIAYNSFKLAHLVMPRSLASALSATLRWSELIRTTLELISWFMSNWVDYNDYDYNWDNDYTRMYRDLMLEALEGCQLPKIASSLCHTKISATYNP